MDTLTPQTSVPEKKSLRFIHVSIIVAIVIVLNLFANYTASLLFKEPTYEMYIKPTQIVEEIKTKDRCIAVGGQWSENSYPTEKGKTKVEGYCNPNYTNEQNYNTAHLQYEKKVFITLVVFAVLLFVVAGFTTIAVLSLSFAWGGVLSLVIASIRYWSLADRVSKVVILGLALAFLIWLAVKKFNK